MHDEEEKDVSCTQNDEFDFQILKLTDAFYKAYPHKQYPEILMKKQRGYNCLLIQSHYDYFICIPFRSNIIHTSAFLFKGTQRSQKHRSGLDYTKTIIIKNPEHIESTDAMIDKDEYMKTVKYIKKITNEVLNYIDKYVLHMNKIKLMNSKEFNKKYGMTTLKYFHKELEINEEV